MITRTKRELCKLARGKTGIKKKVMAEAVDTFLYELNHALLRGERVEIRNWGVFKPYLMKPKPVRNPRTGEAAIMPEQVRIKFKESVRVKALLKEKYNVGDIVWGGIGRRA